MGGFRAVVAAALMTCGLDQPAPGTGCDNKTIPSCTQAYQGLSHQTEAPQGEEAGASVSQLLSSLLPKMESEGA